MKGVDIAEIFLEYSLLQTDFGLYLLLFMLFIFTESIGLTSESIKIVENISPLENLNELTREVVLDLFENLEGNTVILFSILQKLIPKFDCKLESFSRRASNIHKEFCSKKKTKVINKKYGSKAFLTEKEIKNFSAVEIQSCHSRNSRRSIVGSPPQQ